MAAPLARPARYVRTLAFSFPIKVAAESIEDSMTLGRFGKSLRTHSQKKAAAFVCVNVCDLHEQGSLRSSAAAFLPRLVGPKRSF